MYGLSVTFGCACHRLRKAVLFELVKETGKDTCFRCGKKIESVKDLTLDHKQPWRNSENSNELFFNVENIAFSHWRCNTNARRVHRKYTPEESKRVKREQTAAYMREVYTKEGRRQKYLTTGH